ncbi:MAG: ABC transporter ATP-binding protein [Dethiobacter sp.]|jgi:ABC-type branched-subunit amino acid transport system ATPase component|nr:ABC transporter ATP-binding protein [Dethiobacter sp.]
MKILEAVNISKHFGGVTAVKDFSFVIAPGQTVGIIGPNGAGKTTIFNLISGICRPDCGIISLEGREITNLSQDQIARSGIARTFQNIRLFGGLTIIENIKVALDSSNRYSFTQAFIHLGGVRKEEGRINNEALDCLKMVGLQSHAYDKPDNLPYGLQRKLEIARALALKPKVLLLDEPAAGLNSEEMIDLEEFIKEIRAKFGLSIIIIEHRMHVIMELCQWIYVQDFGLSIAEGSPEDIQVNPRVLEAYLGERKECLL